MTPLTSMKGWAQGLCASAMAYLKLTLALQSLLSERVTW